MAGPGVECAMVAQALALYCGPGHRVSLDGAVALLRWFDVFAVFASENWLDWLPTKGLPSLLNNPLQMRLCMLGTTVCLGFRV